MILWLDASRKDTMDKGTSAGQSGTPSDGDSIGYWGNLSGSANLTENTSSSEPIYKQDGTNGLPSVYFDGVYSQMDCDNFPIGGNTLTAFLAISLEEGTNSNWARALAYTGSGQSFNHNNAASFAIINAGNGPNFRLERNNQNVSGNISPQISFIGTVVFDGTNGKSYINGDLVGTISSSGNFASTGLLTLGVGKHSNNHGENMMVIFRKSDSTILLSQII